MKRINTLTKASAWIFSLMVILTLSLLNSCCPDDPEPEPKNGKITFNFEHMINGEEIVYDDMKYTNPAGNTYEVSEIQWFLTDVTLHKSDGDSLMLTNWTFYHYVDTDIPATFTWDVEDPIDPGDYESITFTFGIKGEKNAPYMFVNFPESAMFWPIHLGGDNGGYHYLKLNGFWMDPNNFRRGYQYHLGVGQKQDANGNRIKDADGNYVFVQNWFEVELDNSSFTMEEKGHKEVTIRMNVEEWFQTPNDYDFDYFGGETMENQEALQTIKENGKNVFSITEIKDAN